MTSIKNMEAKNIDEVIDILDKIIDECVSCHSRLAFFAVLYRQVTIAVKEAILRGEFEDNERMERLDVLFANKYLEAYAKYRNGKTYSHSSLAAFQAGESFWTIILQHLLLGMNFHINLDLGLAAAQIAKDGQIDDLENDFNKINDILEELSDKVQKDLARIYPFLRLWNLIGARINDELANFSMKIARKGAWKFAKNLASAPENEWESIISERDQRIGNFGQAMYRPRFPVRTLLKLIRLSEWTSVEKVVKIMTT